MKKELLRIGILCSVFGFTLSTNAQEYIDKKITDKNGNINLVTFKKNYNLSSGSSSNLFSTILNLTPGTEMKLQQTQTSDAFLDENYQMYFNNLKVEFGRYNLHYKNGNLISMNGDVFSTKDAVTTPRISASEAFSKALV